MSQKINKTNRGQGWPLEVVSRLIGYSCLAIIILTIYMGVN